MSNCRPYIHFPTLWWSKADSFPLRRRHLSRSFVLPFGRWNPKVSHKFAFFFYSPLVGEKWKFSNDFPFFGGRFFFTVSSPYLIRMPMMMVMIRPRNVITEQPKKKNTDQNERGDPTQENVVVRRTIRSFDWNNALTDTVQTEPFP